MSVSSAALVVAMEALVNDHRTFRDAVGRMAKQLRAIGDLVSANGCDCECDCLEGGTAHDDEHCAEEDRCWACHVGAILDGGGS